MLLNISHTTHYTYDEPVHYALQKARLRPLSDGQQTVIDWSLVINGGEVEASYLDHYGNQTDLLRAVEGTQSLEITASGTVQTNDTAGVIGKIYGAAPLWHFRQQTALTKPSKEIKALARLIQNPNDPLDDLHALSTAILDAAPYETGRTYADTTAQEALAGGHGVCQDHAHIFISAARAAGLPARYVSGYLMMVDRIDQDASHAWAEVHVDTLGWVGFDVSNRISPDEHYVKLAIGNDARDAAPITGLRVGTAEESMIVSLQVQQ
ncbi:MAG: transglutaminase family protein [Paracoccaceae bacterium]